MKTSVKNFKNILNKLFGEGVDRVRRNKRGYTDEHTPDDYHDVSEEFEAEDVDRLRRADDGYGETDFEEQMDIPSFEDDEDAPEEKESLSFDPMDSKQKKMKAKGHAVPGGLDGLDAGDSGGGPPGAFGAGFDPLAGNDPKMMKKGWGNGEEVDVDDLDLPKLMALAESPPPSDEAEAFIAKHKKDFKKRYGERWKEVLYSVASEKFPAKKKSE